MTEHKKKNEIKISVVVPVFNAEAHLALLMTSLLTQSLSSLEIIAIDDGSTDGSLAMLQEMARADARLTVLSQANRGLSCTRNLGLQHARGQWIAFADSDDWLSPKTLETWCKYAEDAALDMVVGNGFCFVEHPGSTAPVALFKDQAWTTVLTGKAWITRSVAAGEWPHYAWLQLIRRDMLVRHKIAFAEGIVHEDILWTVHLALAAERIGFVELPLYGYRTNPDSITNHPSSAAAMRRAQSYLLIMEKLVFCASQQTGDAPLQRALLRHTNYEGGHFLGLVRKRVVDVAMRRDLARQFFSRGLSKAMFAGVADRQGLWRAIKSWVILKRMAKAPETTSSVLPRP
jgi:glycosyltransferase involved in cell wall biosynthesis